MENNHPELEPFFYGASEHRINVKGQVAFPARFRSVLSEDAIKQGLVLLRGEDACLYCYTHLQFKVVVDRLMAEDGVKDDSDFLRDFFEQVAAVDLDSQGRMVIPASLRHEGGIVGQDVTFIGHRDRVEIWDADRRKAKRDANKEATENKRSQVARRIFGP